jgi:DNA-binding NarL/FixJ family response regulator
MDYFLNSKYPEANNGLEIIKQIKEQKPKTNIILLSSQEDFNIVIDAIKKYGCLYVQKDQQAFNKIEQIISGIINTEKSGSDEV